VDPEPVLSDIQQAGQPIVSSVPAGTSINNFAQGVLAFASIFQLPSSYGLLALTFTSKDGLNLDKVIEKVKAKHRRPHIRGETVLPEGALVS
jgi:hypothetical protein